LTTTHGTLSRLASICAKIALDGIGRAPASTAIQIVAAAKIQDTVQHQRPEPGSSEEILACISAASQLNPSQLAPQARYELTRTPTGLRFKRQPPEISSALRLLELKTTASLEQALTMLGFETYEYLPTHIVTPVVEGKKQALALLPPLMELLVLLGSAAGLNPDLARMASMGAVQEFLRGHYARTSDMKADLDTAEALAFASNVDLVEVLKTTTIEPLDTDLALFAVPDLPMAVLMYVGAHQLNKARKAAEMLAALCGPDMVEVSGKALLLNSEGSHGKH